MKNAPMRFCGVSIHHNPEKLTVENSANMMRLISPGTPPDALHLGAGLWTVRGEGELYGADCMEQYRRLRALYERAERGLLVLPQLPVMTAYLSELRLTAEAQENVVAYRFTFTQALGGESAVSPIESCTVQQGESLWDIAYRCGVSIDELVRLNPQISRPDSIRTGERVILC